MIRAKAILPSFPTALSVAAAQRATKRALDQSAREAKKQLARFTQRWQPNNRPTFTVTSPDTAIREVVTDTPVFVFQDLGTDAHTIRARRGRYLHFYWKSMGQWVRTQQVRHPGTKPRNYTREVAIRLERIDMPRIFDAAFAQEGR